MATVIKFKEGGLPYIENRAIDRVMRFLPFTLCGEIESTVRALSVKNERIEEIRLRSGRRVYLTVGGRGGKRNLALESVFSRAELSEMLERMCDGSLYAYSESIIKGYVSLGEGVRVGVCGRASVEGERILGVYDISALNIRLPCGVVSVDRAIFEQIKRSLLDGRGVLVFSPPAQGKTTFLRSLSRMLSGGSSPMRVALIDSREEFGDDFGKDELSLDIFSGYPKAEGIRIATAFMNPQVIICDEIGGEEEANAISQAQNCGVPLVASAHGSDVESLLERRGMRVLHESGAFGLYVGIAIDGERGFRYSVRKREEIFA